MAAAIWLVYGSSIRSPFIFDDHSSIIENPSIRSLWPLIGTAEHPGSFNAPKDLPTCGRPLVNFSLAINYRLDGLNPLGYHIFNIILHVLSALLLFGIVRRTILLDFFQNQFQVASASLALAAALLWAVHPLQTESVAYTTQRTELMVGLFYLATLYTSLRYWSASSSLSRKSWLALATLACLGGMASKEVMVTAPLIVLLFERTFLAGSFRRAWQNSWPLYIALALGWGLLFCLNYSAPRSTTAGFHLGVPVFKWWCLQAKVFWMYLKLTIWPSPLLIHYSMPYMPWADAWPWVLGLVLFAAASSLLLWHRSALGFAGFWVLLILSPTMIVPIITEVAAERRMYLPLAALITLAVMGGYFLLLQLGQFSKNTNLAVRRSVPILMAAVLLLAVVSGCLSSQRLRAYENELTLWQAEVANITSDPMVYTNLGMQLNRLERWKEAADNFKLSLQLNPDIAETHNDLGLAYAHEGLLEEAVSEYQRAGPQTRLPSYAQKSRRCTHSTPAGPRSN